jgi:hypothetical protein
MGPDTLVWSFTSRTFVLTSGVLGRRAVRGDALSVRLHGKLLEVGRESVEVLIETGNR